MKNHISKFIYFGFIFAFFSISVLVLNAQEANAATLYLSPSSGDHSVGNIFTVNAFVNTDGEAINNSDATINFPADLN
jgi:hypothetical protein